MAERIYLSPPHMEGNELDYVKEAFDSNWIAPVGPHIDAFERECAAFAGRSSALALSSGTAAAQLIGRSVGLKAGDTFFCSSLTFVASVAPFVQLGGVPVFIDSEPGSWNISPAALERAFREAASSGGPPKLVVAVNLYGQCCDMDRILPLCEEYGVPLAEDAAESMGALCRGRMSGSFGRFSYYSFNGNKIITTSGGGMLLSDDDEAVERARFLATQARDEAPWYQHSELGYNFRMSNVLAAIGRAQLTHIEGRIARRRRIFANYEERLGRLPGLSFMPEPEWSRSNRWLTAMLVDPSAAGVDNMRIAGRLSADNIESRPVWKPMHMQPVFSGARYFKAGEGDVSGALFKHGLCLPSGSSLTDEQQDRIMTLIEELIR